MSVDYEQSSAQEQRTDAERHYQDQAADREAVTNAQYDAGRMVQAALRTIDPSQEHSVTVTVTQRRSPRPSYTTTPSPTVLTVTVEVSVPMLADSNAAE